LILTDAQVRKRGYQKGCATSEGSIDNLNKKLVYLPSDKSVTRYASRVTDLYKALAGNISKILENLIYFCTLFS
jgi:hypothetical protein